MKLRISYIAILAMMLMLSLTYLYSKSTTPENAFLGEWRELEWDYESLHDKKKLLGVFMNRNNANQEVSDEDIRIYTAESWRFKPNGVLELVKDGEETTVQWSIKGRGNILEITDGEITEHYDITTLDEDKIELNYVSEIQVKGGFGKLVFEKL